MTQEQSSEVRGHTTYNQIAGWPLRCAASLLDGCLMIILVSMGVSLFHPLPRIAIGILIFFAAGIFILRGKYKSAVRGILGASLGEWVWSLKCKNQLLFQRDLLSHSQVFKGALSTTLALLIAFSLTRNVVFDHPFWNQVEIWNTSAPAAFAVTPVQPLFYSLGAWPRTFLNQPVYYSVLYEKGPPTHFVGHISALLGSSRIRLLIEGPKTPENSGSREELKSCLLSGFSWTCLGRKEAALGRHVEEMSRVDPKSGSKNWKIKWFQVENPNTPAREQTQGIWITADGPMFTQDRFIMINPNGQHQAVILTRPSQDYEYAGYSTEENKTQRNDSKAALEQVLVTIKGLKILSHLDEGRTWINQELQDVSLAGVNSISDPIRKSEALAEVQSLLLSRISVDPASFDSYFHLAGTSFLLARTLQNSGRAGTPAMSAAIQNLTSAKNYAFDLAPQDSRTRQIETLWREIQKK
jgi:hypothetical protein